MATSSVIHTAMDQQEKELSNLSATLYTLETRLAPVLTPVPGSPVAEEKMNPQYTLLSDNINNNTYKVVALNGRVQEILNRLEL